MLNVAPTIRHLTFINEMSIHRYSFLAIMLYCLIAQAAVLSAQNAPDSKWSQLLGRWEVVQYSEQGLQVDKKRPALPQARDVYQHVRRMRARTWYGFEYENADEYSRRRAREFERWEERDSTREVKRIADAIETPYFAVFFPDSTLALYNKDEQGRVTFPESRRFVFSPKTMSVDVYPPGMLPPPQPIGGWVDRLEIQILVLTDTRMLLFVPEEAEVVELIKTAYTLP